MASRTAKSAPSKSKRQAEADPASMLVRANEPLRWQSDADTASYLQRHVAPAISVERLEQTLGWRSQPVELPTPPALQPVRQITLPDWARLIVLDLHQIAITLPRWAEPHPLPVVSKIVQPGWGRDVHLPVASRIALDEDGGTQLRDKDRIWQPIGAANTDEAGAVWTKPASAREVAEPVRWREARERKEQHSAARSQPAQRTTLAAAPLAAEVATETAKQEDADPLQAALVEAIASVLEPDTVEVAADAPQPAPPIAEDKPARLSKSQRKKLRQAALEQAGVSAAETAVERLPGKGVEVSQPLGLWRVMGKALGTLVLAFGAFVAAVAGMSAARELAGGAAEHLQDAGLEVPPAPLQGLLQVGPDDAPVQVVLGCDPAEDTCVTRLRLLAQTVKSHPNKARLIWLPAVGTDTADARATGLVAAHRQGKLWQLVEAAAPGALDYEQQQELLRVSDIDFARWLTELTDADVQREARTLQRMAEGLGVAGAALVAGERVEPTEVVQTVQAILAGDRPGVPPDDPATRNRNLLVDVQQRARYEQWILRGERASAVQEAGPEPAPESGPEPEP